MCIIIDVACGIPGSMIISRLLRHSDVDGTLVCSFTSCSI